MFVLSVHEQSLAEVLIAHHRKLTMLAEQVFVVRLAQLVACRPTQMQASSVRVDFRLLLLVSRVRHGRSVSAGVVQVLIPRQEQAYALQAGLFSLHRVLASCPLQLVQLQALVEVLQLSACIWRGLRQIPRTL